jgi:hypothetical protein
MSNTTPASPFAAPPAGELIAADLDPRRQLAHRAIAGYLAGYSGATLVAYRLDLRQWVIWLDGNGVDILSVQRAHIELYARWSEEHGLARSTISRRLSTICGFYRYCSQEAVIDRDPAAYVRRPKLDYESHTLGLDRNELGAFLVQAGLCGGRDHALSWRPAPRRPRSRIALGPTNDNALRPSPARSPYTCWTNRCDFTGMTARRSARSHLGLLVGNGSDEGLPLANGRRSQGIIATPRSGAGPEPVTPLRFLEH